MAPRWVQQGQASCGPHLQADFVDVRVQVANVQGLAALRLWGRSHVAALGAQLCRAAQLRAQPRGDIALRPLRLQISSSHALRGWIQARVSTPCGMRPLRAEVWRTNAKRLQRLPAASGSGVSTVYCLL